MENRPDQQSDGFDPVAEAILEFLTLQDPPKDVKPVVVAQFVAAQRARGRHSPDLWRKYLPAVRNQAKFLARRGRIQLIHKGEPADPDTVKGLVRYRLVPGSAAAHPNDD